MKIVYWRFNINTLCTFWDTHTWDIWKACFQTIRNNRICLKLAYFLRNLQTSRANNSRILRTKNAKFSRHYFYMNTNIYGDFQICTSVPWRFGLLAYCRPVHSSNEIKDKKRKGCDWSVLENFVWLHTSNLNLKISLKFEKNVLLSFNFFQPILRQCSLLYCAETTENLWFSDVFRGYRNGTLGWNWLRTKLNMLM